MYKFRIKIFLIIIGVVFAAILGRLAQLQVIQADSYLRDAQNMFRRVDVFDSSRGKITDRNGLILAIDDPCYDLCMDYRLMVADPAWVKKQKKTIQREQDVSADAAAEIYRQKASASWQLIDRLGKECGENANQAVSQTVDRVQRIRRNVGMEISLERQCHPVVPGMDDRVRAIAETELSKTIGLEIRPSHKRRYPYGELACHVVGYTGQITDEQLEQLRRTSKVDDDADMLTLLRTHYNADDIIGQAGVEKLCEELLRGRKGYRLKRSGDTVETVAAVVGQDAHLTIDAALQSELAAQWRSILGPEATGSVVVLSVPDGQVLAMLSIPTYDLNTFRRDYDEIVGDKLMEPWVNRAVGKLYPPGSTVKPITALAGLFDGSLTANTIYNCKGYLNDPEHFRCWIWTEYHTGHGPLDLVGALKNSCNIFFYQTGEKLGLDKLTGVMGLMGLGAKSGTGLPEEITGTLPTVDWIGKTQHRQPQPADARFTAIGQGFLTATPMHVAAVMAAIANDGQYVSPQLVLEGGPDRIRRQLPVTVEQMSLIRRGMYEVVNERGGTAYHAFHDGEGAPLGFDVCGKSGTAQTPPHKIDSNGDGKNDKIVREGDTAWFAGFAPYENPKVAFAVAIDYTTTGGGGKVAGPVARELLRACQKHGYITAGTWDKGPGTREEEEGTRQEEPDTSTPETEN